MRGEPSFRPHVLGIDDGPFTKPQSRPVCLVGVMMEGSAIVEGVAVTEFPIDGDGVTAFLADWIRGLRWHDALQAVVVGGATIAGLALIDLETLARETGVPCISVTRKRPSNAEVARALRSAGLAHRIPELERLPPAAAIEANLYIAHAGIDLAAATAFVRATSAKAKLPEPLRVAHLVATALTRGQSHGRP